ncbi:MAG TPA: ammonium transporter [Aeromicrobium sp.]|nr:ammonium transporter [Aeromicrobium sp.]
MDPAPITGGDTTVGTIWLLIASALVIFMTPGLAFFYGGLVKAKSVVSMAMLSFGAMGIISVLWVLYGFNAGYVAGDKTDLIPGILANPLTAGGGFGLSNYVADGTNNFAFVAFGASFAIITVALVSGAIADRARFFPWLLFAGLWGSVDYFLVQGWVWAFAADDKGDNVATGLIGGKIGALDWAGGTAVHINAGAAALALALVLGKRVGFSKELAKPHNVPLVLIGAGILWFGWFGFNVGASYGFTPFDFNLAGLIWINTLACPAAAMLGWIIVEKLKSGKATAVGAASGAVAGLVAITPACAFVTPLWGIVLGLIAGAICAVAVEFKYKLGFDDSLDVVGIHLVGGIIGAWFIGLVGMVAGDNVGLFNGGGSAQLIKQLEGSMLVLVYSFVTAFIIGLAIEKTIGFRVHEEAEIAGLDSVLHEEGYTTD